MAETKAEQQLREAVKGLYRAFAHCKRPEGWMGDGMVVPTRRQLAEQEKKPLRDFTLEEMSDYAWHSICYAGEDKTAIQFWGPRLLELFSFPAASWADDCARLSGAFDIWFIVDGLVRARWRNWPEAQRQPVERWFAAWWEACLAYGREEEAKCPHLYIARSEEDCLEQTMASGLPIDALLAEWLRREDWTAIEELLGFVEGLGNTHPAEEKAPGMVYLRDEPEVIEWVLSGAMVEHLTAVRKRLEDEALASGDAAALSEAEGRVAKIENVLAYIPGLRSAVGTVGKRTPPGE